MGAKTTWYLIADTSQTAEIVSITDSHNIANTRLVEFVCSDGSKGSMDRYTFLQHYTAFKENGK